MQVVVADSGWEYYYGRIVKVVDIWRSWWRHRWFKGLILSLGAVVLLIILVVASYRLKHRNQPYSFGVSFSQTQAEFLGVDWQANYRALLDEMGFRQLRLVSYWDVHEPKPGQYLFDDLDWQMDQAAVRGAKVNLAIGLRQPRWPECREPEWARQLAGDEWRKRLSSYISVVVERYRSHPALASWHLENEFFNIDFGRHCRDFDRQRLIDEYRLVKQLDPNRQLVMALGNTYGFPLRGPRPDIYGVTVYRRVFDATITHRYITHPAPAWYQTLRAGLVEMLTGKPFVIHELQAEPWTTASVKVTSEEEQALTMSPQRLGDVMNYAEATGIKTMYFWGSEWWYWRKSQFNDPAMWNAVKKIVQPPG